MVEDIGSVYRLDGILDDFYFIGSRNYIPIVVEQFGSVGFKRVF